MLNKFTIFKCVIVNSISGMPGTSKDASVGVNLGPMPPAAIRNKKRAAMATSVVSMANNNMPSMREYKKKTAEIDTFFFIQSMFMSRLNGRFRLKPIDGVDKSQQGAYVIYVY